MDRAERYRAEADEWIAANPDAWAYIVMQARRSAELGMRFGMKALCEHVRWHYRVVRGRSEFKLNNNYTAAFTRRLIREHPEVAPFVSTRSSIMDKEETWQTR